MTDPVEDMFVPISFKVFEKDKKTIDLKKSFDIESGPIEILWKARIKKAYFVNIFVNIISRYYILKIFKI